MFTRLLFFPGSSNGPQPMQASEPTFTQNTSHDVVPCKDVPFMG